MKAVVLWAGDSTTQTEEFEAPYISVQIFTTGPVGPRGGRPAVVRLHESRCSISISSHHFADVYRIDKYA